MTPAALNSGNHIFVGYQSLAFVGLSHPRLLHTLATKYVLKQGLED
jgi:hypothetical protein